MEIIPAILPKDFEELEKKLRVLKEAFFVLEKKDRPLIQIDICDGVFVPPLTWPYPEFSAIENLINFIDDFDFEIDLFVEKPDHVVPYLQKLGVKRIILHVESLSDKSISNLSKDFSEKTVQFGFSVNLGTSVDKLKPFMKEADFFQFMGINKVGYQGELFNEGVLEKIKSFRKDNPNAIISVDGGVNLENRNMLKEAGVNRLVAGSAIFNSESVEEVARKIKKFENG